MRLLNIMLKRNRKLLLGILLTGIVLGGALTGRGHFPLKTDNISEKLLEQVGLACDDRKNRIIVHKVSGQETLCEIAAKYNIDLDTLRGSNPNLADSIYQGDEIIILPEKGILYTTLPGDSLSKLANEFNASVETLMLANGNQEGGLAAGEKIFIPGANP